MLELYSFIQLPMILDGKKIAQKIYSKLTDEILTLKEKPCLGAVLVGSNPASLRYIKQKKKNAKAIGMDFRLFSLPEDTTEAKLLTLIQNLNNDSSLSGYIVQLPLPSHIDTLKVIESINPTKDVDGFHPINQGKILIGEKDAFAPCTPLWVMEILRERDFVFPGSKIVILGRSNIVGKPLAALCINAWATVISCNSKTPDISQYTKSADVVVLATGQVGVLRADMIGKDTIVIDVGFTVRDGVIYGDADFKPIHAQWNLITPVPGWVGQLTVAMLLSNTLRAHTNNHK